MHWTHDDTFTIHTIKDFSHTGSKMLSFSVGQQFSFSIQAVEMCPGSASVFCIVVCSKSAVDFCTVITMVSWRKLNVVWTCTICWWLKGQRCSNITDGKFDSSAGTNMSHITRKCFHVNELAEVMPLRLRRQPLPIQAQIFPSKSSGWFSCLPCGTAVLMGWLCTTAWASSTERNTFFEFGACGWVNGT